MSKATFDIKFVPVYERNVTYQKIHYGSIGGAPMSNPLTVEMRELGFSFDDIDLRVRIAALNGDPGEGPTIFVTEGKWNTRAIDELRADFFAARQAATLLMSSRAVDRKRGRRMMKR